VAEIIRDLSFADYLANEAYGSSDLRAFRAGPPAAENHMRLSGPAPCPIARLGALCAMPVPSRSLPHASPQPVLPARRARPARPSPLRHRLLRVRPLRGAAHPPRGPRQIHGGRRAVARRQASRRCRRGERALPSDSPTATARPPPRWRIAPSAGGGQRTPACSVAGPARFERPDPMIEHGQAQRRFPAFVHDFSMAIVAVAS
jgi:hypothetical protein